MRLEARTVLLAGVVASASYSTLAGQNQPEPPPFQSEINYVRVDMYPTVDRKPLVGLTEAEVEVLEDGVPQKIERFEHVSIGTMRRQAGREPSTVEEMRRAAQDPRARVFVLFLDPRHVDTAGSLRVRQPMIDTLNALIGGDDLIAVMTPEMSARGLTFTRRTGSIEDMLAPHWGRQDWLGTKDPVEIRYESCYAEPIIDGAWMSREMVARRREMLVLNALDDLVRFLRGLREERKAVITLSDGWPLYGPEPNLRKPLLTPTLDPDVFGHVNIPLPKPGTDPGTGRPTVKDPSSASISSDGVGTIDRAACEVDRFALSELRNEQRFTGIMQAANRANVSFYPVGPGTFSQGPAPTGGRRRALQMMADMTDGLAIVQSDFLQPGLQRMVDDLSSYYLLGYYSSAKVDGRYHRITVRVKRPGVDVRARAGYLAASAADASRVSPSVTPAASPDVAEAQLVARALNPLAALGRERPLRVQAAVAWTAARTPVVRAVAEVPRGTARGDDWSKGAQMEVALRNGAGEAVATHQASLQPGMFTVELSITPQAALEPGEYDLQVRAKGADVLSPAIETVRLAIQAAPLGAGLVFLRRGPATGNREVLTADARFRRSERVVLESPAAFDTGVTARLLDRTGKPLNVPVAATIRSDASGAKWCRVEVALAPLAPGDYIIETTEGSERTMTGFRVVP